MNTAERAAIADKVRRTIRTVPDFPKPGILFRDITPVLADSSLFSEVMMALASPFEGQGITHVVSIESRGFILGAPVALELRAAFVPVRKPGKLPAECVREDYTLEYGTDALEMHADALVGAKGVLVVDDVLATGGTAAATCRLVERAGGKVAACAFLIELAALGGRAKLDGKRSESLVTY
ncbi:MAG TPA: adenine phosphoribosyltransferase [Gemmatimonadaceae bacterium]|jgi:adenine phosphoribosyltransferase|nr:adenine phosphoribosyltransferase [Gemmatimonadaceae bacterium]